MARRTATTLGVLTGGGDCPGLNAVIRAVVKTASTEYGWNAVGILDGFLGLVEKRSMPLHRADVSGILTRGGTILGTSNTVDPLRFVKAPGAKPVDISRKVVANARALGIDALVAIGGDGTMHIAEGLRAAGLDVVGVPKTIDNDLAETDVTFGFDSACQVVSTAIDSLHSTAMSHHRVMVVETMGRYAGWLALVGGLAGGGDIILIPEIPYGLDAVCDEVVRRSSQGKRFSIVVVAEGAKPLGGQLVVGRRVEGSPDPIRLGGISGILATQIEDRTGLETRHVVLGHLQRGGSPTAADRILATRFGAEAVRLVADGRFGEIVVLRGGEIRAVAIAKAIRRRKTVPLDDPLLRIGRGLGTKFGDEAPGRGQAPGRRK
jgi:6-phosphofructokinase 1